MIEFFPSRTVALNLGAWTIHWYGLMYFIAFILALGILPRLQKYRRLNLSLGEWVEIMAWVQAGVLIGGRFGYVILYEPQYFWRNPSDIFALWQGGMSSHGGITGVALALWLAVFVFSPFSRGRTRVGAYLNILDTIAVPAALGITLGRIGNVINQELFPTLAAQILVLIKDSLLLIVCYLWLRSPRSHPGQVTALFLITYGLLRFLMEFLRQQDYSEVLGLSRGQWYTLPLIALGIWLWRKNMVK